jgi:hypothetical protein
MAVGLAFVFVAYPLYGGSGKVGVGPSRAQWDLDP